MGFSDRLKEGAQAVRQKTEERREAARQEQAERASDAAARAEERAERRARRFEEIEHSCPLPVSAELEKLPGGLELFEDEFLVATGRDWGWSSQKLILTTKRVIYSRGRALTAKDQQTVYLTDVRDVRFHKPMLGMGTLTLETAGVGSIEGLPAAKNGAEIRNKLLTLIHWARSEAERPQQVPVAGPHAATESITEKLKQLGELRDTGVITAEEFDAKKAELLARI